MAMEVESTSVMGIRVKRSHSTGAEKKCGHRKRRENGIGSKTEFHNYRNSGDGEVQKSEILRLYASPVEIPLEQKKRMRLG